MEAKQKEFLKYIGGMVLFVCFVWKYELVVPDGGMGLPDDIAAYLWLCHRIYLKSSCPED